MKNELSQPNVLIAERGVTNRQKKRNAMLWYQFLSILFLLFSIMVYGIPTPPRNVKFRSHTCVWLYWRIACGVIMWYLLAVVIVVAFGQFQFYHDGEEDEVFAWGFGGGFVIMTLFAIIFILYRFFQRAKSLMCCCGAGKPCIGEGEDLDEKLWSTVLSGTAAVLVNAMIPKDQLSSGGHFSVVFAVFLVVSLILNVLVTRALVAGAVRIQFALALSVTLVFSFLLVWKGADEWLKQTISFYILALVVAISFAVVKMLYDWLYDVYGREKGAYALVNEARPARPDTADVEEVQTVKETKKMAIVPARP